MVNSKPRSKVSNLAIPFLWLYSSGISVITVWVRNAKFGQTQGTVREYGTYCNPSDAAMIKVLNRCITYLKIQSKSDQHARTELTFSQTILIHCRSRIITKMANMQVHHQVLHVQWKRPKMCRNRSRIVCCQVAGVSTVSRVGSPILVSPLAQP